MSDMSGLFFEDPPEIPKTFNTLLYGPPKSGKSTAAATAPGPILWVNAEGPNALDYARKVAAERNTDILEVRVRRNQDTRQLLRDVIAYVKDGQEPRPQTVVVDTLAKIRDALIRQLVVPGAKNSIQQFGEVAKVLGEFVNVLRDEPVNLVLIAHQSVNDDADTGRIVEPLIGGALTNVIPGEVDVLAYCGRVKTDEGVRYVGQLVEGKGRNAGDRSGALGEVRDLDLSEWLGTYRAGLTPDTSDVPFLTDPAEATPEDLEDEEAALDAHDKAKRERAAEEQAANAPLPPDGVTAASWKRLGDVAKANPDLATQWADHYGVPGLSRLENPTQAQVSNLISALEGGTTPPVVDGQQDQLAA